MRQLSSSLAGLFFLSSLGIACGGSVAQPTSSEKTSADGNGGGASISGPGSGSGSTAAPPSTTPLLQAVDANVVRIEIENVLLGGVRACPNIFGGPDAAPAKMTYDRATHVATWNTCDVAAKAYVDTSRSLADAEVAAIEAELSGIRYQTGVVCDGWDGAITTMTTFTSTGASQLYADRNLNCYTDGRRYANVDGLYTDLLKLRAP